MRVFNGTNNSNSFTVPHEPARPGRFRPWTIYGYGGFDYLQGGPENDTIYGGQGQDILYGMDGDDVLYAGDPGYSLDYSSGWLNGGNGNDILIGNAGKDDLYGGNDNDRLYGGGGDDNLYGGRGNDVLEGDNGYGVYGDDKLEGGDGNDTLKGWDGSDTLVGGSGDDRLIGYGSGNQYGTISTDAEYDILTGDNANSQPGVQEAGDGADTFVLGDVYGDYYLGASHAVITDFYWREGDKIQLNRSSSAYTLGKTSNVSGGSALDTQIFYEGDLIAVVEDTTDVVANLDFTSAGLI